MTYRSRFSDINLDGWLRLAFAFGVMMAEIVARGILFFVPNYLLRGLESLISLMLPKRNRGEHVLMTPDENKEIGSFDFSTAQLIRHFGYRCEEHITITSDGFSLSLHRVLPKESNDESPEHRRPPVFLQHGLMQCSEVWVCTEDLLAFRLVDQGYDVWLGNSRGNKYSCHHRTFKPIDVEYWDFSLDKMAQIDLPTQIDYILGQTGAEQLSFVGFSQGSALGFACFSLLPHVADKINLFTALSPASKAKGLKQGMLQTFVHLAPQSLFLLFGNKGFMKFVLFWRASVTRAAYARLIDRSCTMLFDWHMESLGDIRRKQMLYAHLFSLTSVKTLVHWFQVVACDRFQQYDDNQDFTKEGYRAFLPQAYPVSQIKCPMAVFYGGADKLTDIPWLLRELPVGSKTFCVDAYEHLDPLWAADAKDKVFPLVVSLINSANRKAHMMALKK